MKSSIITCICSAVFSLAIPSFAADCPEGCINFHNASNKNITAEVSAVGKFSLSANETKTVSYSMLMRACSSNLTHCTAQFYADNVSAGTATIDVTTGKLISMNLSVPVHTVRDHQVLRSVIIS